MNRFVLILKEMTNSKLPELAQFAELLKFLALHGTMTAPPENAQFNNGLNHVNVETKFCANCLKSLLSKEGFQVAVGTTEKNEEGCHDCPNHHLAPAE